ncbi:MAG: NAD-dependent epimerase/dehydratase family protein [Methylotenera sp.]
MAKILIVGCGDLGSAIATRLQQNHEVIGLRLSSLQLPHGIQTIQADVTKPNTLTALENLNPNFIIYCVAASAQTDENYQAIYVDGLKNVLTTQLANQQLQHVFFVSSTRIYGKNTEDTLDENTLAIPADFGGERLLEAEMLLKGLPCKTTTMRLSGIYGEGRLYLVNMANDLTRWPKENRWSNRIHRDDAAGFIAFLVQQASRNHEVSDSYIVTDDMPTQQYEVLAWLAKQQGIDTSNIKAPIAQGGKRLSNLRLRTTGFQLQYPNYQAGYRSVLQNLILQNLK